MGPKWQKSCRFVVSIVVEFLVFRMQQRPQEVQLFQTKRLLQLAGSAMNGSQGAEWGVAALHQSDHSDVVAAAGAEKRGRMRGKERGRVRDRTEPRTLLIKLVYFLIKRIYGTRNQPESLNRSHAFVSLPTETACKIILNENE